MSQRTINRLREHGIQPAQVSAHHAADFAPAPWRQSRRLWRVGDCIPALSKAEGYYENVVVSIGPEPHPVYAPISAIGGGPPFHPRCVHVLTPFVERLATEEERKAGLVSPAVLNQSPAELQHSYHRNGAKIRNSTANS